MVTLSMHDAQLWIYIIVGLIYFLARSRKKSRQQSQNPSAPRRATPPVASAPHQKTAPRPSAPRNLTFEELLREITESKKAPVPKEPEKPTYVDYDDNLEDESKDLEEVNIDRSDDQTIKMYEDARRQAFVRPMAADAAPDYITQASTGRFKSFENSSENKIFEEYIKSLKDPEGFRKAFILSELINRKHF